MTWWNKDNSNWTPAEYKEALNAYWRTFMASIEGQKVLAHLRLTAAITESGKPVDERLTRIDFVEWIRQRCGPEDELARIQTEAKTAAKGLLEQPAEQHHEEFEGFADDVQVKPPAEQA